MCRHLLLLQCLSLLIIAIASLPVDETAKKTGETIEITPTEEKPKTEEISDLDDLEKIIPDTVPDQQPEFDETAKKTGETIEITPTEEKPKMEEISDLDDLEKIIPDTVPDQQPESDDTAKNTGDTVETVEITPTEDKKLPKTETSDDNGPKTGQSLEDLDKIIPELLPHLPDLPKVPDVIPDCKRENETCSGFPACCGDLVCYWESGFSFVKKGLCVPCVELGQSCYRSGQCCGNNDDNDEDPDAIICDKATNPFDDGSCAPKRTSGKCYKNKQCKGHKCDKKWYRLTGNCVEV